MGIRDVEQTVREMLAEKLSSRVGNKYTGKITFEINCHEDDIKKISVIEQRSFTKAPRGE